MSDDSAALTRDRRRIARLNAVQALYQIEIAELDAEAVIAEFIAHRLGYQGEDRDVEDGPNDGEPDWFRDVVNSVTERLAELDGLIDGALDKGRNVGRLEPIMRALLRAAIYELVARIDVPARVVVNEYVDVAHAFFSGNEPAFANGVIDRIAHQVRVQEFGKKHH
ncbi:transcription antitermination factor NusB [Oceanibacterium hippocampi]|uniref:Transcription antitermination protein NusB n=1 Tax=Oceanibacterium hippocampi TaxID=745714 RepID=A0A1Y5SRK3_9PROT|nr:transcription antitermination factor NusB [Oceanibacterium hippocampi]SLN44935.1 hypothetical protein OCH7691_01916 [Oceanibacterium hippocampi]